MNDFVAEGGRGTAGLVSPHDPRKELRARITIPCARIHRSGGHRWVCSARSSRRLPWATRRTSPRTGRSRAAPRSPTPAAACSQAGFDTAALAEGQDQRRQRRRLRGRRRAAEHPGRRSSAAPTTSSTARTSPRARARSPAPTAPRWPPAATPCRGGSAPSSRPTSSRARTPSSRSAGSWARPTCGSTARRSPPQAVLQGSEPEYDFDITSLVKPGANAIALKLYPNNPGAMLNQDFNDWTQAARDQNTGLKYPVRLHVSNALHALRRPRQPGQRRGPVQHAT